MKAVGALMFLVAIVVAGCGGSASQHKAAVTQASGGDCARKQITTQAAREGTCISDATRITVVNRASWLPGDAYDVRLLGVRTVAKIGGAPPPTGGQFAILTLAVRNHGTAPPTFDRKSDLAYLLVNRRLFPESSTVAGKPLSSFRFLDSSAASGGTTTKTLVFDVPTGFFNSLQARGSDFVLLAANEAGRGFPEKNVPTLGFIRLWK